MSFFGKIKNLIKERKTSFDNADESDKKKVNALCVKTVACFLVVAVVSTFYITSLAWFGKNTKVQSNGGGVSVDMFELGGDFSVFAYDLNKLQATDCKIVKNESGTDETVLNSLADFDVNTHDAIFEELNEYTAVLVQVDVFGKYIAESESGSVRITLKRSASAYTSSKLYLAVSNVLAFRCGKSSEIDALTSIDDKWNKAKDLVDNSTGLTEEKLFIAKNGDNYEVAETIYFDLPFTAADKHENAKFGTAITAYIYIDYNVAFTQSLIAQVEAESEEQYAVGRIIPVQNDLAEIELTKNS